jgi:hypothetical protein
MRTLTLSAALAAGGALVARTAALVAILALGAMVLALVVLAATYARAEGRARDHPAAAGRVVVAVTGGVLALGALAGLTG